jgi:hypothetical protein
LKLEVWLPPWDNPRANISKEKGATMKVNTKQRKKATKGFEQIYGKDELANRMFHILTTGNHGYGKRGTLGPRLSSPAERSL